jgi:putative transposase
MIERQVNSFLVSYANYLNNKYNRKGGLFQKPFKRIQICDDGHLQQAIIYSNANAQKHQLVNDFREYPYSSFNAVINYDYYFVDGKNVGGIEKFIKIHEAQVEYFYGKGWPSSKLE